MSKLAAVRVEIRATVTSFRYPHFLIGRQPSFEMPPPSTVYGHVASALGEVPPRDSFRFAYCFTYKARISDYEHQHIITAAGPKQVMGQGKQKLPVSVNATVQPHLRDFLFEARLILYLDSPSLASAFRSPVFPVILGRSQDLAEIVEVQEVGLESQPGAYLENTLLPFSLRDKLALGYTVWMPRYVEPAPDRHPVFDRFIVLRERVYAGAVGSPEALGIRRVLSTAGVNEVWWVDPETPSDRGVHRGLVFHPFTG